MENPNELVARLRRERNLTQVQLAEAMGTDTATLSRVENGMRINAEQGIRFSKFFGRPLEDFYPEAEGVYTRTAKAVGQ